MRSLVVDGDNVISPAYRNPGHSSRKQLSNSIIIAMIILFCVSCILFRFFYKRYDTRRRSSSRSQSFGSHGGFIYENRGIGFDHAIWHIRTVGLHQSLIDSILVLKYKSGEGLIEGTECSVCLNEFREEDSLRLLPKCSHAFHLPCIDTWLRSHQNCPLCRAPVINANIIAQVELSLTAANDFGSSGRESGSDSEVGNVSNELPTGYPSNLGSLIGETANETGSSKTQSDYSSSWDHVTASGELSENQLSSETETQALRRSLSFDSSTAQEYHDAVSQGFSATQHSKASTEKVDKNRISGSLSFRKLIGSSSIAHSQQIGTSSVKKSSSSLGKPVLPSTSVGDFTQPM